MDTFLGETLAGHAGMLPTRGQWCEGGRRGGGGLAILDPVKDQLDVLVIDIDQPALVGPPVTRIKTDMRRTGYFQLDRQPA